MKPNWGNQQHILQRLQRLWDSGRLLSERLPTAPESPLFPLRIPLKPPTASELDSQFDQARQWISQLQQHSKQHGYLLEWRSRRHRIHGENRLPVAALLETAETALKLLGKNREAQRFDHISHTLLAAFPELHNWLARKPLTALKYHDDWPRLLAFIGWLRAHPRPGIYLRQIDLPGVHTKFIEAHRGLLTELLDQLLPATAIDPNATGVRGFEARYGFRSKPVLIRFRLLDKAHYIQGLSDLSIPLDDFVALKPRIHTVIITENDINGLALPPIRDTLVIFGLGYGVELLKQVKWLADKRLYYWGDIDTHGFAMLEQLRHYHPHVNSLLMDASTLKQHQALCGKEDKPLTRPLQRLNAQEQAVYQTLLAQPGLRLEQERIGFDWVKKTLPLLK